MTVIVSPVVRDQCAPARSNSDESTKADHRVVVALRLNARLLRMTVTRSREHATMRTREQNHEQQWNTDPRWNGITRPYSSRTWIRLRGSIQVEHTLARLGAERLWWLLHSESYVPALGALTGNQAVQQVQAGLKAIYLSGWQVAADANDAGQMYPDQSLYPADSVPNVVRKINNALMRADQIHHAGRKERHLLVRADRGRCRSRLWRHLECLRVDEGDDRSRRGLRTLRGSACPPRRNADTWAGKSWCRPRRRFRNWWPRVWQPTCWACRR